MTTFAPSAPTTRRMVAPAIDFACLVTFILAGAGQHNVDEGIGWFLTVLWPLVVAWFGIALLTHIYTNTASIWPRLTITLVAAALLNAVLRWAFTDRPFLSVYTAVFLAWMVLTAFGWRAIALLLAMRRARRAGLT